jgi:hypothetical protein
MQREIDYVKNFSEPTFLADRATRNAKKGATKNAAITFIG